MSERAAIVTAAGASSRMRDAGKEHKALLDWGGRPLVAHQVECLRAAGADPVVVVTGAEADAVEAATPEEATVVRNAEWRDGRSGSIEAGAEAVPDGVSAVLVVAVDQPLEPRVLAELRARDGEPLVQPVDEHGQHGHPVILGGEYLEGLRDVGARREGLRTLVRELRPEGRLVVVEGLRDWDLNEVQEYRRAQVERRSEGVSSLGPDRDGLAT